MEPTFIHLRAHSAFSLAEGSLPIAMMAKLAADLNMPALAITDTGNLFGALEFSDVLADKGLQPIIGCALRVDFGGSAPAAGGVRTLPTLVLLAKNDAGYRNLIKLSSKAWLDSPVDALPHVTFAELELRNEGLICLSGGPGGPLNEALVQGQRDLAEQRFGELHRVFGNRLYVELQRHQTPDEQAAEPGLVEMAYAHGVPLVATNEPYFARPDDFEANDALICIAGGEVVSNDDRRRLTPEHYFKSQQEMAALFADIPEAIERTVEVAKRCAFRVKGLKPILPRFADGDEAEALRIDAHAGLTERLRSRGLVEPHTEEDYRQRLDFEIDVIARMQFPGYFLIVADFIKWAKVQDIPVGPGRGSGAGSMVAYALTITDLDPFRFNLLFERFLNPERVSMPDFDIDFCQERRDEVITYVQGRYGADRVAQIITFGKLQARAVCRDVGRVLQMPYGQVDRLSKMIPMNPANPVTLAQAIDGEPRLKHERDTDPQVSRLLDIGLKLEGLYRHASTHAAGLVIGDRPLEDLVPLYRDPRSPFPATQFNMKYVEKAGLVKFDFLGLKTLTVLHKAQSLIRVREPDFDIEKISFTDEKTYALLGQGDAAGVFQLESSGMRDVLRRMRPDCIEDIIAIVALYRPGPMDNIPRFIACKKGEEVPDYLHPLLEPLLTETYGVVVYQEQVMQIAQVLSGYSLGEADLLRRAMGKKIRSEMEDQKERFISGALGRGVESAQAALIFDLVEKFAGYGFNKSHAAAYAVIAYQTAWLKANYPVEFLAASMSLDLGNTDKLQAFRREAQRMGVVIRPPSINESMVDFAVSDGAIVYSLAALKNVGSGSVRHLMEERDKAGPFRSLGDFANRVDTRFINKRALESMVKAGAFDGLNPNRAQVLAGVDTISATASRSQEQKTAGQHSLFGEGASDAGDLALAPAEPWDGMQRLAAEFEAVGFYLSGHPLDDMMKPLASLNVESWAAFRTKVLTQGAVAAKLAGTVLHRQERRAKSGVKFAFVGLSDPTGQYEAICFSDTLALARPLLEPGTAVIVRVEADLEGEEIKLRLQSVEALVPENLKGPAGLAIHVADARPVPELAKLLKTGGRGSVNLFYRDRDGCEITIALGSHFNIDRGLKQALRAVRGVEQVEDT